MSTRIKKIIGIVSILVLAVVLIFFAIVPWFVSTDIMRSAITRDVSAFIGRSVEIRGNVSLQLLPTPKAVLQNIVMPAKTEKKTPLLTIETIEADVALLTLLSRKPEFTNFALFTPHLNLVRNQYGYVNWEDGFKHIHTAIETAKTNISNSIGEQPLQLLPDDYPKQFAFIEINNGRISISDEQGESIDTVSTINGTIDWPILDEAASIQAQATWQEETVNINLQSDKPLAVLAGSPTQTSVSISYPKASLEFDGPIGFGDVLFAEGSLSFQTSSLSELLKIIGTPVDAGRAIGAVEIDSAIKLNQGKASLETQNLVVDQNVGAGVLELSYDESSLPTVNGTLDFESLDLNAFLAAFIPLPDGLDDARHEVELDFTSQLQTDLRLSAEVAVLGSIQMTNLAATAQINTMGALFDVGDAEAYDGSVQARLHFTEPETGSAQSIVSVAAQNIDLAQLKQTLELPVAMPSGIGTFSLDAEAPLGGWSTMVQSAKGALNLKITNGSTTGFGAQTLMENVNQKQFFALNASEQSAEPFNLLNLAGNLADGIMAIEQAEIDYPAGKVVLNGVAPYRSGGIALTASILPSDADNDVSNSQFFIGGSWSRAFATLLDTPVFDAE